MAGEELTRTGRLTVYEGAWCGCCWGGGRDYRGWPCSRCDGTGRVAVEKVVERTPDGTWVERGVL